MKKANSGLAPTFWLRLAAYWGFGFRFFYGEAVDEPNPDIASFRALSKITAAQRDAALGSGAIALMLNDWIEKRFQLPAHELPDLSREASPEAAAQALRAAWGLGDLPIKNVVHLLEPKGVRVVSLSIDAAEIDAFSMWRQSTPFVFLNSVKSAEHGASMRRTNWGTWFCIAMGRQRDGKQSGRLTPLPRHFLCLRQAYSLKLRYFLG